MSIVSLLSKALLSDAAVSALCEKTGLSKAKLKKLIPLAIPVLIKALTKNVSTQDGLQSLLGALTQHTETKSLAVQINEADETDGGKILGHILGNNSNAALSSLAAQSGLNVQEVSAALSSVTPALMSGLSAAANSGASVTATASGAKFDLSDGFDMTDVMAIFGGGSTQQSGGLFGGGVTAAGGLLGSLLGKDNKDSDDSQNGTALLSALLSARK